MASQAKRELRQAEEYDEECGSTCHRVAAMRERSAKEKGGA